MMGAACAQMFTMVAVVIRFKWTCRRLSDGDH